MATLKENEVKINEQTLACASCSLSKKKKCCKKYKTKGISCKKCPKFD